MEKSNKGTMIILIILLVLLLVLVGGVAFFGYQYLSNRDTSEATPSPTPESSGRISQEDLLTIPLDEKTTNLLKVSTDGKTTYYIKLKVTVLIDSREKRAEKFIKLAESRLDVFYAVITEVCLATTNEKAKSPDGLDYIKDKLIEGFRLEFATNLIYDVNIENFLINP